jgi:hypothetical protein
MYWIEIVEFCSPQLRHSFLSCPIQLILSFPRRSGFELAEDAVEVPALVGGAAQEAEGVQQHTPQPVRS